MERARDEEFWAALWQGQGPPDDFELIAAYNLMTNLRVIVFNAEKTASIRWLDMRFNMVGKFTCHPALDQTVGYHAAFARDVDGVAEFLRKRRTPEPVIQALVDNRRRSIESPSLLEAVKEAKSRSFTEVN